jgi:hypothetical protein
VDWVVTFRLRRTAAGGAPTRYLYDILWVHPDERPGLLALFGDLSGDAERLPVSCRDVFCMHGDDAGAGRRLEKPQALLALRILETDFSDECAEATIIPAAEVIAEEA